MKLGQDKTITEIISRLERGGEVKVEGTWGSFAPLLAVHISEKLGRPILYICPHIDDADRIAEDLRTFGGENVETLGAWEGGEDLADATDEIRAERMRVVMKVLSGGERFIIAAAVQALCQPIPKPDVLKAGSLELVVEKKLSPQEIVSWLVENGFERVEKVDLPGQFAHRGGIVDIYMPFVSEKITLEEKEELSSQGGEAVRIEFFGDTIESIREINLDTQRSGGQIKSIRVVSTVCGMGTEQRELFINILPAETIIIFEEPGDVEEVARIFLERVEDTGRLYGWEEIYRAAGTFARLFICRFAGSTPGDFIKVNVKSIQQFQHTATAAWAGHKEALEQVVQQAREGKEVYLYCESPGEVKRIGEIAAQSDKPLPEKFRMPLGYVGQGFAIDSLNVIVISHHELFGQFALRRRQRAIRPTAPVDSLEDLQAGDYVVHTSYGIGKFLGVKTIKGKEAQGEYLTIEFADKEKMQVSVSNIGLVQKYIGTSPKRPKLSKVGSKKWQRQKEKVAKSIQDLAGELLEIQARRRAMGGIVFGPDSDWQAEFEQSFPYQETPDQLITMEQIKADMQQPVAMDRLLCGDVGYGKTELAMRAVFKAVENGRQAAVLVPTTVLCVQHSRTFGERFADFPVCIETLNRFKTAKQSQDIIKRARQGKVDILIGTHRLLSGDIGFADLGLLIIDEEQRFGVEHKEKLKKLRFNVDILTMTATPIPRTLHMALLGLRDISSLATPPLDRRSIVTTVTSYSDELIRKAIMQELNRQGQVFFLHNRVRTIDKKAGQIQKLVKDAKVAVAHGQMAKHELEKTMIDFVLGRIDVLVCTTIIESGLDIPNANTMFVDNADQFGLAELHQLRGRVGRYKHRAYAYMLLPTNRPITPAAARRLKAIEEYSHLGAGFRIALRDLEIRGAGNILGAEQSGHIQVVGYQMYCELLAEAVRRLKGEKIESRLVGAASLDLGFAVYIPRNYIPLDRSRMDAYRKIATARSSEDIKQIEGELADVYGLLPEEVRLLLELAELRIKASRFDIRAIAASGQDLVFSFAKDHRGKIESLFAKVVGKVRMPEPDTVYLRLPKNYFEPRTLIAALRKILSRN